MPRRARSEVIVGKVLREMTLHGADVASPCRGHHFSLEHTSTLTSKAVRQLRRYTQGACQMVVKRPDKVSDLQRHRLLTTQCKPPVDVVVQGGAKAVLRPITSNKVVSCRPCVVSGGAVP